MRGGSLCITAGLVFWLLAIHPFLTYPLSLLFGSRDRRRESGSHSRSLDRLSVAICTCAYNEERLIERKISNLLELRTFHPDLELLVYVDGASDGTAEIVASHGARLTVEIATERRGKTYGMNCLVARCSADIVIFTDANVVMSMEGIKNVLQHFEDPTVGCVCGNLRYTNAGESVTASTGSLYWRLEQFIKRRESGYGAVMGADGSLFAIRRNLHRPPPDHIIDDMYVSFQILCEGFRVIQVDDFQAFEASVTSRAEEFRRKIRIGCQAFNVHRLIWPVVRRKLGLFEIYMYLSHKWLRWLCIYFIVAGTSLIEAGLVLNAQSELAIAVGAMAGLAIIGGACFEIPILSAAVDMLLALLGAGIGVWRSLRGEQYQTWQPAISIRN